MELRIRAFNSYTLISYKRSLCLFKRKKKLKTLKYHSNSPLLSSPCSTLWNSLLYVICYCFQCISQNGTHCCETCCVTVVPHAAEVTTPTVHRPHRVSQRRGQRMSQACWWPRQPWPAQQAASRFNCCTQLRLLQNRCQQHAHNRKENAAFTSYHENKPPVKSKERNH